MTVSKDNLKLGDRVWFEEHNHDYPGFHKVRGKVTILYPLTCRIECDDGSVAYKYLTDIYKIVEEVQ